jgi:hypothetical protein
MHFDYVRDFMIISEIIMEYTEIFASLLCMSFLK